jgi:RHS repeat-associated protein
VLEDKSSLTGAPERSYLIGHNVIAQADGSTVRHLLYDGGGSTRGLLDATGQPVTDQIYAYDAFGNRFEDPQNPIVIATPLLYRGEYFDAAVQHYHLRARYYGARTGTFLSFDSHSGSSDAPLTLHKYLYGAANPIYYADPSGMLPTIPELKLKLLIWGAKFVTYIAPILYMGQRLAHQATSSGIVQRLQMSLNSTTSGVYHFFGRHPNLLRLDAGIMLERVVNPAMRLLGAQPQVWIQRGTARVDWLLWGRHLIDTKLGQFISWPQFQVFLREAVQRGGTIHYITLTSPPPATVQQMISQGHAAGVRVVFWVLTPL